MGYYVSIESSTFMLEPKHYDDAYKAMCALNLFDDIKRGGSYHKDQGTGVETKNSWFSWMSPNYPETLTTANQIFEDLGFEINVSETGTEICGYDNKTGQEDLFLEACCPWASGYILWRGEEGDKWMDNYDHVTVRRYSTSEEWIQDKSYIGAMKEALDYVAWRDNMRDEMRKERETENVEA
jgi:hypothetical protein